MTKQEAEKSLLQGLDCAQTVFGYFAEELGIPDETAHKISAGFGGGMFTGDTCGAVVGAIMAISAKYGHTLPVSASDKALCREKVLEFKRRYTELRGSCLCRDLLGADLSTPEGEAEVASKNLLATLCPQIVADAATIVADIFDLD